MFKLLLYKNDGKTQYDITSIVGQITWDSNLSLTSALEMDILWNDTKSLWPKNPCDLGDVVLLFEDGKEIYRGVVATEVRSGRDAIKYTVFDYAWYLGKSKSVYQFKTIASNAILKILKDFGMLVGNVPTMSTIIDEIYMEKSPAEIIEDIYKRHERKTGKRYNVEMRQGQIYFEEIKDLVIKGTFRLAPNLPVNDVFDNPLGADRSRTIDSMRNRVKILIERSDDEKNKGKAQYEVVATAQDQSSILKFGLLEDTYKIDEEDASKAKAVSEILLDRLNKIHETNSLKLMGDSAFKAGRLLVVDEPITGMKNTYMIIWAKHTVVSQQHTMEIELALPEEVA